MIKRRWGVESKRHEGAADWMVKGGDDHLKTKKERVPGKSSSRC